MELIHWPTVLGSLPAQPVHPLFDSAQPSERLAGNGKEQETFNQWGFKEKTESKVLTACAYLSNHVIEGAPEFFKFRVCTYEKFIKNKETSVSPLITSHFSITLGEGLQNRIDNYTRLNARKKLKKSGLQ